ASGQLRIEDGTGIVLVLLPPGSLRHPTRRVRLDPVFLSKYEMTQGQWLRATGENPSVMCPERNDWSGEPITLAHPVGFVSWPEADRVMRELGLALQTWAQGEYGCRAGTTTKWWTGDDLKSLEGAGNFADQANLRLGIGEPSWSYAPWDDGCASIARVGSYRPNPFGLYDVHGNAAEWCADSTVNLPARDGDGGRFEAQETGRRVSRDSASRILETRSEAASAYDTPLRFPTGGVRPARAIEE
ncbi:MAG: formylglycine-generating enzyme family protein, partial [Planctomycetota bacterium]